MCFLGSLGFFTWSHFLRGAPTILSVIPWLYNHSVLILGMVHSGSGWIGWKDKLARWRNETSITNTRSLAVFHVIAEHCFPCAACNRDFRSSHRQNNRDTSNHWQHYLPRFFGRFCLAASPYAPTACIPEMGLAWPHFQHPHTSGVLEPRLVLLTVLSLIRSGSNFYPPYRFWNVCACVFCRSILFLKFTCLYGNLAIYLISSTNLKGV